ncbi:MAG: hypothetical protein HQL76_11000 [Magnetococcales bacterium]|nr:hypothetical protein [Magnetococcales bacterium]
MDQVNDDEIRLLASLVAAFSGGKKNFVLEDLDDGDPRRAWMAWSETRGWVDWQVRSSCDHQCRLGSLTDLGREMLGKIKDVNAGEKMS